jgi:hypothetical protein
METMKKSASNKQNTYVNRTTYNRSRSSRAHFKKSFALDIYRDPELDFTDIGLLTWMLSNSRNYIINKNRVMARSGLPEKKFLASWKKLQEMGYVEKIKFQGGIEWVINEIPRS